MKWRAALVISSLVAVLSGIAVADEIDQAPPVQLQPRDSDVAVVIGIAHYREGVPDSSYSDDDAKTVKAYLLKLGFRESRIELLVNDHATRSDIVKTVKTWLPNQVKPDSRVFFYYSGHGAPDATNPEHPEAYLLPYDGDPSDLADTAYPRKELLDRLGKLPAQQVVVVLDSCFSGAGGRSVLASGARPLLNHIVPVGAIAPNLALLTATQGNQISTSDKDIGHGVLTYFFLKALRDGRTTLTDIYNNIKPEVEDRAKALNVQQTPALTFGAVQNRERFQIVDPAAYKAAIDAAAKAAAEAKAQAEKERQQRDSDVAVAAEKQKLEDEKKRLEAERQASEQRLQEERARLEREAQQRAAEQQWQLDQERRRLQQQQQQNNSGEATFVPPTF